MRIYSELKARFPKLFPVAVAVVTIGAIGGVAVAESRANDSCCYPGSACCHPGSPCCAGHSHAAR